MKRYLVLFATLLTLGVGWGWLSARAQNITQGLQGSQDGRFIGMDANKNVYWPGHMLWSTTGQPLAGTPTLSICTVGGTPTIVGTDWVGQINAGSTAATSCAVTFTQPYLAAPTCFVEWSSGVLAAESWVTYVTGLVITQTSNASSVIEYMCSGAK